MNEPLTPEQAEQRRKSTEKYCIRVYQKNAELRMQIQELMDGLADITALIEPHHVGATGRLMTTREIGDYIAQLQREQAEPGAGAGTEREA